MPLFSIFDISSSGMSAQSVRLNLIASNLSNAQTASSSPEQAYHAKQAVFASELASEYNALSGNAGHSAGVRIAGIVESDAPLRVQYDPKHPQANEEGYVYYPNVNLVEEMANMISTSRTFQSNVDVMNTSKTLLQRTLTLGD